MDVPKFEADLGIEVYASGSPGVGGKIRFLPEDFKVEEILIDGSKAPFQPSISELSGWGRYLLCVLTKRNLDTLMAIGRVAEHLRIDSDRIQIAGIKDAKAITAQHLTISGVSPEKICAIGNGEMTVRPLRFSDERLSPRLLFGNRFQIAIRALEHRRRTVDRRIERIWDDLRKLGGLPNFFGHQRFGTTRPITHLIGYCIVKRDFENAAFTFLSQTSEFEYPDSREARQYLSETRDFRYALKCFPERLFYERLMLKHLVKYPRDFLGAFRRLPLRLRKLFVQAYQSFLFNKLLSERMKQGIALNEPQIGDYVIDLDDLGLPTERYYEVTVDDLSMIKRKIDESEAGIALPLVGFKQPPPEGDQRKLEEENISPHDFHIPEMREVSSPGGLRLILTPVIDFYSKEPCEDPLNPEKLMTELGFTLHRSSYATILLREFMKVRNIVKAGF